MEALWLLTAGLVPVLFAPQTFVVFVDVPKVAMLRSLVGLMVMLWAVEWALRPHCAGERLEGSLWARFRAWTRDEPSGWVIVAATLFLAVNVISALLSPAFSISLWGNNPGRDGYGLYNMASYYLLFLVIATHLKTKAQLWRLMGVIVAAASVASLYGILQYFGIDPFDQGSAQRVQSSFGNPLFAASFLVMAIPLSLGLGLALTVKSRSLWMGAAWAVLATIQMVAVLFTLSRGPWIGLAIGLMVWFVLTLTAASRRTLLRPPLIAGLVAVVILGGLLLLGLSVVPSEGDGEAAQRLDALFERAISIGDQVTTAGLEGRASTWRRSASLIADRPWFGADQWWSAPARRLAGYGPELFLYALPLRWEPEAKGLVFATAHNYLIHTWVELGVLGVVAYLSVWAALVAGGGAFFLRMRRSLTPEYSLIYVALLSSLVVRFVEQITGVARVSDLALFWTIAAMVVALPSLTRDETTPDDTESETVGKRRADARPTTSFAWRLGLALVIVLMGGALIWQKNISYVRASTSGAGSLAAFQRGDLPSSLELMDMAINLAPDVSFYYTTRAEMMDAFVARNRSDEIEIAAEQLALHHQAIEANPLSHEARMAAAASALKLAELGQKDAGPEAIRLYNELALMLPGHEQVFNDWAIAYLKLGQPDQALAVLDAYASFVKGRAELSPDALYLRSVAYQDLGRTEDALAVLREFLTERSWGKYSEAGNRRLKELASAGEEEGTNEGAAPRRAED